MILVDKWRLVHLFRKFRLFFFNYLLENKVKITEKFKSKLEGRDAERPYPDPDPDPYLDPYQFSSPVLL